MDRNQFYYTTKVLVNGTEAAPKFEEYEESFNVLQITRTRKLPDGRVIVLLNDVHQRLEEVPILNKSGKMTAVRKENVTYQSEILLSKEDGYALWLATHIFTPDVSDLFSPTINLNPVNGDELPTNKL